MPCLFSLLKGLLHLHMDILFKNANNGQIREPGSTFSRGVHICCMRLRHFFHFSGFAERHNDRNDSMTVAGGGDNNVKSGSKYKQASDQISPRIKDSSGHLGDLQPPVCGT